jgi:hypothetical protein
MQKHLHHIVPKHAGGNDDSSNLIELSIEEHANAHRLLYEKYGRWEDFIAWQGLSGSICKEEIIRQVQVEAGKRKIKIHGNPWSGKRNKFNWADNPEFHKHVTVQAQSPESCYKRKQTFKKIKHAQGVNNSQFGKMWITDGKNSKTIKKTDSIPEGWKPGRVL